MLLFITFCPIAAAILIMVGEAVRLTEVGVAISNVFITFILLGRFDQVAAGFQFVSSFVVSADWRIHFAFGVDGLSLLMLLLATSVSVAAVWFAGKIENYERAFYACLLFISAGAIGAFASIDLFFFYAFHELALIPTFLLIGIWGTGNRNAAAWKITIYLTLGSFVLLIGLILLYQSVPAAARPFDIHEMQAALAANPLAAPSLPTIQLLLLI